MIQTQLLRLDPPYQIISAAGQIGIQLATLIVTEEKTTEDGQYRIDTHSHPVVSYGLKEGLFEQYKYCDGNPDTMRQLALRLQPEGAVWNRVEINNIRVLGLAGAKNEDISLERFVSLVPKEHGFNPLDNVWSEESIAKIYNLFFGLNKVELKTEHECYPLHKDEQGRVVIKLQAVFNNDCIPLIRVVIRDEGEYRPFQGGIDFCVKLFPPKDDSPSSGCVRMIVNAMAALKDGFLSKEKLIFVSVCGSGSY